MHFLGLVKLKNPENLDF